MDGKLDLKTAFWGYGFFGSIVIGIGCGVLVETVSNVFNIVYVISITVLIIGLWQCASNYKKIMSQKKAKDAKMTSWCTKKCQDPLATMPRICNPRMQRSGAGGRGRSP